MYNHYEKCLLRDWRLGAVVLAMMAISTVQTAYAATASANGGHGVAAGVGVGHGSGKGSPAPSGTTAGVGVAPAGHKGIGVVAHTPISAHFGVNPSVSTPTVGRSMANSSVHG